MEEKLNPRVREIQISGIRKFFNRLSQYPDAISLTLGQPDFPTPEHVKEAGVLAIRENHTTYTPNAGILPLRQAISRFLHARYGLSYDPEGEIIVTNGASEAIDITLRTLLTEGDEVVLPGPIYPGYEPLIFLAGARPIYLDTRNHHFLMTAETLEPLLTERTKLVLLPYPSNPTGRVLPGGELKKIADLLEDREIFLLSDEIYSELIYEGTHRSIASFPGMRKKTILINGLSKSHSMTGWRIGYTAAPEEISRHLLKVHQYNATCASSISQYAALEALENGLGDPEGMREEYRKRRDFVWEELNGMGLPVTKPEGAFYLFPSIRSFSLTSWEFAEKLLEKEQVAVVPGSAFSPYGEGYVRISYAASMDHLKEGMKRLRRFVKTLTS
ncbi:N-acetyl-L,L-diaminopimelate aminotransferase [[Clostridium] ultunense Esp]|uniref:aminotransferase A n=1 Tax=Thermicanus aegyptius TaxID=94009 RepID=UPI0002B6F810|nr:aminotransferase A [Thermicanus aegyptius]CCQ93342.1 N-acetyl-L,L-diaminopimelate aminotransferase [[Clostridium] ultunense Esp]